MDYPVNDPAESHTEAYWHLIHLVHISCSMLALFLAYSSIQNLVSSVVEGDVGYWSLATIYIVFCVSSITVGPVIVAFLKPKYSIIISSLGYLSFIIANGWPSIYSLLPTAALLGVSASVLWTAQGTYLTQCAVNYSLKRGSVDQKADIGLFTGIFFAIFQTNQIIGNLIAGSVLDSKLQNSSQLLSYIFMSIAGCSVLSFFFMKPQPETPSDTAEKKPELSFTENIFRAFILLKQKEMIFLVPLYFYSGLEQGFVFGSFTKDIIGRTMGTEKIGYVMSVFGVMDVLGSFGFGKLADTYSTNLVAAIGFIIHTAFFVLFFGIIEISHFHFFQNRDYLIYLGAILCGLGDAVWNTFPGTITSKLFTHNAEAAFAVFKFSQSLGSFVIFAAGAYLTIEVKLTGFFGFMVIALISIIYMNVFVFGAKKVASDGVSIQDSSVAIITVEKKEE